MINGRWLLLWTFIALAYWTLQQQRNFLYNAIGYVCKFTSATPTHQKLTQSR